jgi:hypothetical protein
MPLLPTANETNETQYFSPYRIKDAECRWFMPALEHLLRWLAARYTYNHVMAFIQAEVPNQHVVPLYASLATKLMHWDYVDFHRLAPPRDQVGKASAHYKCTSLEDLWFTRCTALQWHGIHLSQFKCLKRLVLIASSFTCSPEVQQQDEVNDVAPPAFYWLNQGLPRSLELLHVDACEDVPDTLCSLVWTGTGADHLHYLGWSGMASDALPSNVVTMKRFKVPAGLVALDLHGSVAVSGQLLEWAAKNSSPQKLHTQLRCLSLDSLLDRHHIVKLLVSVFPNLRVLNVHNTLRGTAFSSNEQLAWSKVVNSFTTSLKVTIHVSDQATETVVFESPAHTVDHELNGRLGWRAEYLEYDHIEPQQLSEDEILDTMSTWNANATEPADEETGVVEEEDQEDESSDQEGSDELDEDGAGSSGAEEHTPKSSSAPKSKSKSKLKVESSTKPKTNSNTKPKTNSNTKTKTKRKQRPASSSDEEDLSASDSDVCPCSSSDDVDMVTSPVDPNDEAAVKAAKARRRSAQRHKKRRKERVAKKAATEPTSTVRTWPNSCMEHVGWTNGYLQTVWAIKPSLESASVNTQYIQGLGVKEGSPEVDESELLMHAGRVSNRGFKNHDTWLSTATYGQRYALLTQLQVSKDKLVDDRRLSGMYPVGLIGLKPPIDRPVHPLSAEELRHEYQNAVEVMLRYLSSGTPTLLAQQITARARKYIRCFFLGNERKQSNDISPHRNLLCTKGGYGQVRLHMMVWKDGRLTREYLEEVIALVLEDGNPVFSARYLVEPDKAKHAVLKAAVIKWMLHVLSVWETMWRCSPELVKLMGARQAHQEVTEFLGKVRREGALNQWIHKPHHEHCKLVLGDWQELYVQGLAKLAAVQP